MFLLKEMVRYFFSLPEVEFLKLLFGRNVDLLSYRALRNAVIMDEIEEEVVLKSS